MINMIWEEFKEWADKASKSEVSELWFKLGQGHFRYWDNYFRDDNFEDNLNDIKRRYEYLDNILTKK